MITSENVIIPNLNLLKDVIIGEDITDYEYKEKIE